MRRYLHAQQTGTLVTDLNIQLRGGNAGLRERLRVRIAPLFLMASETSTTGTGSATLQRSSLQRSMGLTAAASMVVGIIVGVSIFVQPSEVTRLAANQRGIMLVWLASGVLTLCAALVCAELAWLFPETGGVYVFLKRIYSPAMGFLWGWGIFWVMHTGILAAIAVVLARYAASFLGLGEVGVRLLAVAAIILVSIVQYLGVKLGSAVQVALTAAKLAAIGVICALLFALGRAAHHALPAEAAQPVAITKFGLAVAAGLFSYGGFHMLTYTAGEVRDPQRTIPRALVLGVLIVTACYMLLNAAYLYVLPVSAVAQSTRVAADAASRVLGPHSSAAITLAIIVSALGALNGIALAGPRVYYAMAQDGLAFRWMAALHPARRTPHLTIAAQAAWACVLAATNSYRALFTRVVYTEWLFFALLAAGIFVLHRRGEYQPKFLRFGFPLLPAATFITAAAIAVNQIYASPRESALGLGLILLGLPVYFVWSHRRAET
ncbi:MAG TPA: amino acid permease [Candidatus Angelobacter sp.]|nr:amino acid permease [Candidatus Angelobacter sp.]